MGMYNPGDRPIVRRRDGNGFSKFIIGFFILCFILAIAEYSVIATIVLHFVHKFW